MSQIDKKALENIRLLQRPESPDLVVRIVGIFVTQTPDAVNAILDAVAPADLETIRTTAHSIKSSAAYVGATTFSARMAELEKAAREGQLELCQKLTIGLDDHASLVIDELTPHLNQDQGRAA